MTYHDQWKALSNRILGLMQAAQLHARFLNVRSSDTFHRWAHLQEHIGDVYSSLEVYRDTFQHTLPPMALDTINRSLEKMQRFVRETGSGPLEQERVWAALVLLGAFEIEMSFMLSDIQQSIRSRAERAFSHLERLIVVDPELREKWQAAFRHGEVACEKLGATHLLLHGIFAFKVDAAGARTDLVFQEPAENLINEQRYVDGFVLTEWKKATSEGDAAQRYEQARSQAQRYAQGALAGSELTAYRYLVVVSRQQVSVPEDLTEEEVVYRHINIAVDPRTPSRR